jgi:hypothetical protein
VGPWYIGKVFDRVHKEAPPKKLEAKCFVPEAGRVLDLTDVF